MQIPSQILLKKWLDIYLESRNIDKQYQKAKDLFLNWDIAQIDLRIRQPKQDRIFYFKINKQYRVYWYFEWNNFFVFHIDDHQ